jgi:putative cardiolipin synthase
LPFCFLRCAPRSLLLIALVLTGCAGLPPRTPEPPTQAIAASPATALGRAAIRLNTPPDGLSSLRPLIEASYALDARLELIRRAQSSLDVQTYQLGNDKTGRLLLRELRDAARRGVRVRLLLDDFYTAGMDRLLLGLAVEPNAEVRLFNPFVNLRDHSSGRWLEFFGDFRRLNHRMHNKLFVADGAMAIAGGRNLADEYFLRSESANFIDFEVLMAGPVVRESAAIFDTYWNSDVVYPLQRVAGTSRTADELKSAFDTDTSPAYAPPPDPLPATDLLGDPPLAAQLANIDEAKWMRAEAHATADSPNKALGVMAHPTESLAQRFHEMLATAQSNVVVISPYFIPGDEGMARIRMGREHGINITVITNSLADSDEPLVNINYNRYRVDMLKLGVNLYEVSTQQLRRSGQFRDLLKKARGRLHAKLALGRPPMGAAGLHEPGPALGPPEHRVRRAGAQLRPHAGAAFRLPTGRHRRRLPRGAQARRPERAVDRHRRRQQRSARQRARFEHADPAAIAAFLVVRAHGPVVSAQPPATPGA